MTRPKKNRNVGSPPRFSRFKPVQVPVVELEPIILSLDEYEALRLADYKGLDQADASELMGISRPTFTRLVEKARLKIADFLINGKSLQIEGGVVHFIGNRIRCLNCGFIVEQDINDDVIIRCPKCGSRNLQNLAEQFGHGQCCQGRGRVRGRGQGRGRFNGPSQNRGPGRGQGNNR